MKTKNEIGTYLLFKKDECNEWICFFDSTDKNEARELAKSVSEDSDVEIRMMEATLIEKFIPEKYLVKDDEKENEIISAMEDELQLGEID